jgi:site-specific DNA recombinase
MIKAVIYARVSTAEQAEEGYSIEAQLENVRKKCQQEGREVVDEYIDRGVSGKSIEKRFALQKLIKDAKEGKFEEVWVWKTNRLARNHLDLLKIIDTLNRFNVGFKSCSEAFDTSTPTGKLLMNVLASIGEFERETIVENVKIGMKQRAKLGKWNGGQVLGYKTVKCYENDKTRLEIVEDEAKIVRHIYNLYAEGKGLKSITNYINQLGYRTKKGNLFSTASVREILRNPIYVGKIRYNLRENWSEKRRKGINKNPIIVQGEHDPIITPELWEKVQKLYSQRSYKPIRNFSGSYPLTGILKCPICGSSMVAGRVKKKKKDGSYILHRYYHCGAWRNKGIAACRSNGVRADLVEEIVFNKIKETLFNKTVLRDIVDHMNTKRKEVIKPLEDQLKHIDKALSGFENKKSKLFELYEDGVIGKDDLSERLKQISNSIESSLAEKEAIKKKLEQDNSQPISYELVSGLMAKFNDILNKADHEKKKFILHLVIKEILLNPDKSVRSIVLHFNEKTKQFMFNEKEDESTNEDSSSFYFALELNMDC